jgi:hypothetical protein
MRTRTFVLLGAALILPGCQGEPTAPDGPLAAPPPATAIGVADSAVLLVAGDLHTNCINRNYRQSATAAIVAKYPQAIVIPLGDNAGQHGTTAEHACYDQSWGQFKSRTYATIGNHELNQDTTATAYYDYFNGVGVDSGRAGHRARGYYTVDHGGWRIFVANNHRNITAQTAWMTKELAASPRRCTMALWHHPFLTSSAEPANVSPFNKVRPWWTALYQGGADVVLAGHVHSYERLAKVRPDGVVDTARGIREFVVGTGGAPYLYDFKAVPLAGSQKRIKTWGVLKLTLWPTRYKWEFIDVNGVVLDRGSDRCH